MRSECFVILIVVLLASCIERIDAPIVTRGRALVVDGSITNTPGSHTVRLVYSMPLTGRLPLAEPVLNATVKIIEDESAEYYLTEVGFGKYETTEGFVPSIGHRYALHIETSDGRKYESAPSLMRDPGTLDEVIAEFRENSINPLELWKPQHAYYFYANGTGSTSPHATKLLRWRWHATYQIHTAPEKRVRWTVNGPVPDPPACASPCTCCDCWRTFHSETVSLSNPSTVAGNSFNKIFLGMIPAESHYFYDKLLIRVDQMAVSEEVYSFWDMVKAQQEGAEDLFQPPIVRVRGNVFSVDNPTEEVFGIFSVAGVSENRIELRYEDIPKKIPFYEIINDSCQFFGGTTVKPPFY
jgi:hypothetical protein